MGTLHGRSATDTTPSRAERLDRLPFTREHGKLVVGSGIGWALDAMDVGRISSGAAGDRPGRLGRRLADGEVRAGAERVGAGA